MEAERLREYLHGLNIPVHISDEHTHSLQAANPMAFPALWVEDEYDSNYVRTHIREFLENETGQNEILEAWTCQTCGESNPGNFGSCWQCGADRNND